MLKFIGKQWRGELPFWVSIVLFSLLVPAAVVIGGTSWLGTASFDMAPYPSMALAAAVFTLIGIVGVWQLVGTWRATSAQRAQGRWTITRWLGRAAALASFALAVFALSTVPAGISRLYAEANDQDVIGKQGFTLVSEGDRIIVGGHLSWGLYDRFRAALEENDEVQTIVLSGPGGHYGVGVRMARLIRDQGLDTLAVGECASACTIAFMGGHTRTLESGARLGYHAPWGEGDLVRQRGERHITALMHSAGIADEFISRVLATPADRLWYPTLDELQQNQIITEDAE